MRKYYRYFKKQIGTRIFVLHIASLSVALVDTIALTTLLLYVQNFGNSSFALEILHFTLEYEMKLWLWIIVIGFFIKALLKFLYLEFLAKCQYLIKYRLRNIEASRVDRDDNVLIIESERVSTGFNNLITSIESLIFLVVYFGAAFFYDAKVTIAIAAFSLPSVLFFKKINRRISSMAIGITDHNNLLLANLKGDPDRVNETLENLRVKELSQQTVANWMLSLREPLVAFALLLSVNAVGFIWELDNQNVITILMLMYRALTYFNAYQVSYNHFLKRTGWLNKISF